jgi:ribonuclease VapC
VIVIDTSALMALLLDEPEADQIADLLKSEEEFKIAAGTLAEVLIVAGRRGISVEMSRLIEGIAAEIEPLNASGSIAVAEAYSVWGKGLHPAGLNFGDCFSYVTAKGCGSPLLYVGDDFSRTDIRSALS